MAPPTFLCQWLLCNLLKNYFSLQHFFKITSHKSFFLLSSLLLHPFIFILPLFLFILTYMWSLPRAVLILVKHQCTAPWPLNSNLWTPLLSPWAPGGAVPWRWTSHFSLSYMVFYLVIHVCFGFKLLLPRSCRFSLFHWVYLEV